MKRLVISIVILCVVFAYSISTLFIVQNCNKKLASTAKQVQVLFEDKQYDDALKATYELKALWEEYEKILLIMIRDDKLIELNISMAKLDTFVKTQNDDLISEIQSILFQLDHIYETECLHWYNFF